MTWTGGLYVHIPFCATICPYCDFAVVAGRSSSHATYLDALLVEARNAEPMRASSIFIGGGTPSFVDPAFLGDALAEVHSMFDGDDDVEVTIECNPETTTAGMLRTLASVNRVSIGAQSFDPLVLRALGRTHSPDHTAGAVRAAREAGIDNVSVDLIYGTPEETDTSWEGTLRATLELEPEHISCYSLMIEEGTPFARTGVVTDEDVQARRYETAVSMLAAAGFDQYEVSNWARPGRGSKHNMTYWTQGDYLGLGLGAHSHRQGHRWWNTRALNEYLVKPGAVAGEERLTDAERADEWVMLRVRLVEGVPIDEASARLGRPLSFEAVVRAGLGVIDGSNLRLTPRGLLMGNQVAAMLAS